MAVIHVPDPFRPSRLVPSRRVLIHVGRNWGPKSGFARLVGELVHPVKSN